MLNNRYLLAHYKSHKFGDSLHKRLYSLQKNHFDNHISWKWGWVNDYFQMDIPDSYLTQFLNT